MKFLIEASVDSDPDIRVGEYLTIERADGRSVWRARVVCEAKAGELYRMREVDAFHRGETIDRA